MSKEYITASDIARFLDTKLIGKDMQVLSYCSIDKVTPNSVTFSSGYMYKADTKERVLIIVTRDYDYSKSKNCSFIVTDNPRLSFSKILNTFFHKKRKKIISKYAVINNNSQIGVNVEIQDNVVICGNSVIGNNVSIGCGAIILENCYIGDGCTIAPGAIIGNEGLGVFTDKDNNLQMMKHMGRVVLKNDVYIGSNSTIGRGTINDTVIERYTKIGPQVNIGHNTTIGSNCEIAGRSTTCGSVVIGDRCFIGAGSTIKESVNIGNNCKVGIGSIVIYDMHNNTTVSGLNALELRSIVKFKIKHSYK